MFPQVIYNTETTKKSDNEIVKTILKKIEGYIGQRSDQLMWAEIRELLIDMSRYCTLISILPDEIGFDDYGVKHTIYTIYYNQIDAIIYVNRFVNERNDQYWIQAKNVDLLENEYNVPIVGYEIWDKDEYGNVVCQEQEIFYER